MPLLWQEERKHYRCDFLLCCCCIPCVKSLKPNQQSANIVTGIKNKNYSISLDREEQHAERTVLFKELNV